MNHRLTLIFILCLNMFCAAQDADTGPGIFEKPFEYYDGQIKHLGTLKSVHIKSGAAFLTFVAEGIAHKINTNDHAFWGYRNNEGVEFRYFEGKMYKIAMKGPVMMYCNYDATVKKDEEGNIISIASEHIYISNGPNNPVLSISETEHLIKLDFGIRNELLDQKINEVEAIILYNRKNQ